MDENVGIIVVYKYLVGSKAGKIYKKRFETPAAFAEWDAEYETPGFVEIINSKVVTSDMVYWDDRWVTANTVK